MKPTRPQLKTFSLRYDGYSNAINSDIWVFPGFDPRKLSDLQIKKMPHHKCVALWDTGATGSVITKSVVEALSLNPIGETKVSTAGGERIQETYFVNFYLPNKVGVYGIEAVCGDMGCCDVLVGMDVITKGDFCFTNAGGKSLFTFQMPATHRIDFVEEVKNQRTAQHKPIVLAPKVGRNSPCPCGSGKKYKQCCGKA